MTTRNWLPLALLLATTASWADSPVWKISRGGDHLFLGGTIHVLAQSDWPLPAAFEEAYSQAAKLVFETDLNKINDPQFVQSMLRHLMYTDGQNLASRIEPDTYQLLEAHLNKRDIPIATILPLKAGMVASTLTVLELQRLGLGGMGVDEFYNQKAATDHKQLGQLETAEQQIEFIGAMGSGREDELIAHTLRDLKQLPALMDTMKQAWRQGDNSTLQQVALTPWITVFPELYASLLTNRNNAWLPQIEAMLTTAEVELVLVGALHLVGDDGLLSLLLSRGYRIEQL